MRYLSTLCRATGIVFCFLLSATSWASSVTATGFVHSKTPTTLKIQRPDSSTVNASCLGNSEISTECSLASNGQTAWGRATCSGGQCTWTCLDVETTCMQQGQEFTLSGTVLSKETCAGVLYLTVLSNGVPVKGECPGDAYFQCQDAIVDGEVSGIAWAECSEIDWLGLMNQ